jgi:CheY-like chemotaxis protein
MLCRGVNGGQSAPGGTRTHDLRVKSPLLYQLSYRRANLLASKPISESDACHRRESTLGATNPNLRSRPVPQVSMDKDPSSPDVPLIRTVLVVDDAGVVRRLSFRVLSEAGYRVFEAASAVEAIEVLAMLRGKVDLVLVDVIMPEVNGVDLVRLIREEWEAPAILFMSAYPAEILAREGLKDLRVQFLAKPFTRTELLLAVERAMAAHAKSGAARRRET